MSNWKSCENCGDRSCYEDMKKIGEFDLTVPRDDWRKMPCPFCGGSMSGLRRSNKHFVRHCYSCHMEFPIDRYGNPRRVDDNG